MRASKKSISEQLNAFSSRMAALPEAMSEIWHRAPRTLWQLSLTCASEGASAHQTHTREGRGRWWGGMKTGTKDVEVAMNL